MCSPIEEENAYLQKKFSQFLDKFGNNLKVDNYNYEEKFKIFSSNFKQSLSFKAENGINGLEADSQFLDMTPEEFKKHYLNLKVQDITSMKKNSIGHLNRASNIPESFNWVDKKVVNEVRNQGSCGSCWAFSAVGNIEGQFAIKHSKQVVFSPQQLVDCDHVDEDAGCNGGLMESAFKYLESTKGLEVETDYKYTARDGTCKYSESKGIAKVKGYKFAPSDNEDEIAEMLVATGPLAVALDATPLQYYSSGIVKKGCTTELNHGVLIVGYGVENGTQFWIVKNSWGGSWGERGFFRILKGHGTCGINTYVISSELE